MLLLKFLARLKEIKVCIHFRADRNEMYYIKLSQCEFDNRKIFPWYFCYQFNEGKEFEQQIEMYHQGTTLNVKKLNIKTIGQLKIFLPEIQK